MFPEAESLSDLLYLPTQKQLTEQIIKISTNLYKFYTNLPRFQGARPDHVRVESSSCCFPRELVSFDPWHVTRSPPIRKRI